MVVCSVCLRALVSDDHTRVKLSTDDDDDTSDFINASYIPVAEVSMALMRKRKPPNVGVGEGGGDMSASERVRNIFR